jgi:hypothetical protein
MDRKLLLFIADVLMHVFITVWCLTSRDIAVNYPAATPTVRLAVLFVFVTANFTVRRMQGSDPFSIAQPSYFLRRDLTWILKSIPDVTLIQVLLFIVASNMDVTFDDWYRHLILMMLFSLSSYALAFSVGERSERGESGTGTSTGATMA